MLWSDHLYSLVTGQRRGEGQFTFAIYLEWRRQDWPYGLWNSELPCQWIREHTKSQKDCSHLKAGLITASFLVQCHICEDNTGLFKDTKLSRCMPEEGTCVVLQNIALQIGRWTNKALIKTALKCEKPFWDLKHLSCSCWGTHLTTLWILTWSGVQWDWLGFSHNISGTSSYFFVSW